MDLNLLVVLDALLEEAHVSRAALRLNLSQPAVSNALQRCRELFDDPLLERGRGTMHRTARAEALRGPLKSLLADVHALVDPPDIALHEIRQVVRITAADDPTFVVAAPLIAALSGSAPGLTVIFQSWSGTDAAAPALLDGETDIAISTFAGDIEGLDRMLLLEESYVVAMRRDHPAAQDFSLEGWLGSPHVVVSGQGALRTPLDAQLAAMNRARRVGVVVASFQLVPPLLSGTDLMAMLPRHGIGLQRHSELVTFEPPIDVPGFPLHLAWHQRQSKDRAVQHVIAEIRAIFARI
jgi:DNA-binding transcriptional LysR family regulator